MVRAPPCHGGSCGFEPRLPRIFFSFIALLFFLLSACSSPSLDDFRAEGQEVNRALIIELKKIRSRDDLPLHEDRLKLLFGKLVDVIQRAKEYKKVHPESEISPISPKEQSANEELRFELNRVLRMDGGKEVIEKAQAEALERLFIS